MQSWPEDIRMNPPERPTASSDRRRWRINLSWIGALLLVWFLVTFVISWHARALTFPFFQWPFSFWVGAQGALIVYLLIIVLYAWRMNRLDREAEAEAAAAATTEPAPPTAPPPDA